MDCTLDRNSIVFGPMFKLFGVCGLMVAIFQGNHAFGASSVDVLDVSLMQESVFNGQAADVYTGDFKAGTCVEQNAVGFEIPSLRNLGEFSVRYSNSKISSFSELELATSSGMAVGDALKVGVSRSILGSNESEVRHIRLELFRDVHSEAEYKMIPSDLDQLKSSVASFRQKCGFGYLSVVQEGYVLDLLLIRKKQSKDETRGTQVDAIAELDKLLNPTGELLGKVLSREEADKILKLSYSLNRKKRVSSEDSNLELQVRTNLPVLIAEAESSGPKSSMATPEDASQLLTFDALSFSGDQMFSNVFQAFLKRAETEIKNSKVIPPLRAKYVKYNTLLDYENDEDELVSSPDRQSIKSACRTLAFYAAEVSRVRDLIVRVQFLADYTGAFLSTHHSSDLWGRRKNVEAIHHYLGALKKYLFDVDYLCAKSSKHLPGCSALIHGNDYRSVLSEAERPNYSDERIFSQMRLGRDLQCSQAYDFGRMLTCLDRGFKGLSCLKLRGSKFEVTEEKIIPKHTDPQLAGAKLMGECLVSSTSWEDLPLRGPQRGVIFGQGIMPASP